ncbi:hypothetical protein [Streptomyces sp. NPDC002690]
MTQGTEEAAAAVALVGYQLVNVEGDGDCLYNAFSFAANLRDEHGHLRPASWVRQYLVARLGAPTPGLLDALFDVGVGTARELADLARVIDTPGMWNHAHGDVVPFLLAREFEVALEYFPYQPGRDPGDWEVLGEEDHRLVSMVRLNPGPNLEHWAAATPMVMPTAAPGPNDAGPSRQSSAGREPDRRRAGGLFGTPETSLPDLSTGDRSGPRGLALPSGTDVAPVQLPGTSTVAGPAGRTGEPRRPSVIDVDSPLQQSLYALGDWARHPWHERADLPQFGFRRAGTRNLKPEQEGALFTALRTVPADTTVGDVLRRVHATYGIVLHAWDALSLHHRYQRRYGPADVGRQGRAPVVLPSEELLAGVDEDERRLARAVADVLVERDGAVGNWHRGVELSGGRRRSLRHWVGEVRNGRLPIGAGTLSYLRELPFFSEAHLTRVRVRAEVVPVVPPSEELLDGVPEVERRFALAVAEYVVRRGSSTGITNWHHVIETSDGQTRAFPYLVDAVRNGRLAISAGTMRHLSALPFFSDTHLTRVRVRAEAPPVVSPAASPAPPPRAVVLPSEELLDGVPEDERRFASAVGSYIADRGDGRGVGNSRREVVLSDGQTRTLGYLAGRVRDGHLEIAEGTMRYLSALPFFSEAQLTQVRVRAEAPPVVTPPEEWLDGVPEVEQRFALAVAEYVAARGDSAGITNWQRAIETPTGETRSMRYLVDAVRNGRLMISAGTMRYLSALPFFSQAHLAKVRVRAEVPAAAPPAARPRAVVLPSEELLAGVPEDERRIALAVASYVADRGDARGVGNWRQELTLSDGQTRAVGYLVTRIRDGHVGISAGTLSYLRALSVFSEAHLTRVRLREEAVVPPALERTPVALLHDVPDEERRSALAAAQYLADHRGARDITVTDRRIALAGGRSRLLRSWADEVRNGRRPIGAGTMNYLRQLGFFTEAHLTKVKVRQETAVPGQVPAAGREETDAEERTARTGAFPAFSARLGDWRMPGGGSGRGQGPGPSGPSAPPTSYDPQVVAGVGSVPQWQWISQGVVRRGADYRVTGQGRRPVPITRLIADRHGWNTGRAPAAVSADVPAGVVPWNGSPAAPFFIAAHRAPGGVDVPTMDGMRTMSVEQFADHVAEVTRAVHPGGPIVLLVAYAAADGEYLPRMVAARTGRTVWATDGSLALRPERTDPRLGGSAPATWIVLSRADEAAAWPRWLPSSPAMLARNTDGEPQHEVHTAQGTLPASELSSRTLVDERGTHLGRAMFDAADWAARSSSSMAMGRQTTWAVGHPLGGTHLAPVENAHSFPLPWAGAGRPTPYFFAAHGFPNTVLAQDIWQRGRPLDGEAVGHVLRRRPSLQFDQSREIVLFVCFGASPAADGRSTAQQVADITGRTVHAADGIVAFDSVEEESLVESGSSWYTFRPGRRPQATPYQQPVSRRQQYSAAPTMGRYFTDRPDADGGEPSPTLPSKVDDGSGTSAQWNLARSMPPTVPPDIGVPLGVGTASDLAPRAVSTPSVPPVSPAGTTAPLTGSAALRILEPEDGQQGLVLLVREADGPAALSFSADMTLAVGVDGTFQSAYATAEAIERSNAAMAAAGSGVRLRRDENHHTDVPSAEASGPVRLYRVTPVLPGRPEADAHGLTSLVLGGHPDRLVFRDRNQGTATAGLTGRPDGVHRLLSELLDDVDRGRHGPVYPDAPAAAEAAGDTTGPGPWQDTEALAGRYGTHLERNRGVVTEVMNGIGGNTGALARVGEGYVTHSLTEPDSPYYASVVLASEDGRHQVTLETAPRTVGRRDLLTDVVWRTLRRHPGDRLSAWLSSADGKRTDSMPPGEAEAVEAEVTVVRHLIELRAKLDSVTGRTGVDADPESMTSRMRRLTRDAESEAVDALDVMLRHLGLPDEADRWRLRLVGSGDGETFHDVLVRERGSSLAFTTVVARAANRALDVPPPFLIGDGSPEQLAAVAEREAALIPSPARLGDLGEHHELGPFGDDFLADTRRDLDLWLQLAGTERRRATDPAGEGGGKDAQRFRSRTGHITRARREAEQRATAPLGDAFLDSPSSQLLQAAADRRAWSHDLRLALSKLAETDGSSVALARFVGVLDSQVAHLGQRLRERDGGASGGPDPRVEWILDRTGDDLAESAHRMRGLAWAMGQMASRAAQARTGKDDSEAYDSVVHGTDTDAPDPSASAAQESRGASPAHPDRDLLKWRQAQDEVLTASQVLMALAGRDRSWSRTGPEARRELIAAELSTQRLRPSMTEAALHRLAHLNQRWGTSYRLDEDHAPELLRTLHTHLASPSMTAVTNVQREDFRVLLSDQQTAPSVSLAARLRAITAVPAALVSAARQRAGGSPHSGYAIHWKHDARGNALHTPVPPPEDGVDDDGVPGDFWSAGTMSSLHALVVRGDEAAVRLALAEATDYAHDPELRREHRSGRHATSAHFGVLLPGHLSWQDVDHVVFPHWDETTRKLAETLTARLPAVTAAMGGLRGVSVQTPPPLVSRGTPEPVHTQLRTKDDSVALDYVPATKRAADAMENLVGERVYLTSRVRGPLSDLDGEEAAPWSPSLDPGERPVFVRADRGRRPGQTLVQFDNGVTRDLSAEEFAARVADDLPPDTPPGPVVLLVPYGGAGHLEMPRLLAARTDRAVWAFTADLEVLPGPGEETEAVAFFQGHTGNRRGMWVLSLPDDLRAAALRNSAPADVIVTSAGRVVPDTFVATTTIPDARTFRPLGRSSHGPRFQHEVQLDQTKFARSTEYQAGAPGVGAVGKRRRLPWTVGGGNRAASTYFWDSHSNGDSFEITVDGGSKDSLTAPELTAYLRRRPSLRSMDVVLVACKAGDSKGGAPATAQRIADTLGRKVYAGNTKVNGVELVDVRNDDREAGWLTFVPRGQVSQSRVARMSAPSGPPPGLPLPSLPPVPGSRPPGPPVGGLPPVPGSRPPGPPVGPLPPVPGGRPSTTAASAHAEGGSPAWPDTSRPARSARDADARLDRVTPEADEETPAEGQAGLATSPE